MLLRMQRVAPYRLVLRFRWPTLPRWTWFRADPVDSRDKLVRLDDVAWTRVVDR